MSGQFVSVVDQIKEGMRSDTLRFKAISENIANISTPGYKRSVFADQLIALQAGGRSSLGTTNISPSPNTQNDSVTSEINVIQKLDTVSGPLRQTGNPWDVAITGGGYLEIKTETGVYYTRNGSLKLDSRGHVTDEQGNEVVGAGVKPFGMDAIPVIDSRGRISFQGQVVGQLRIMSPLGNASPTRAANGYFFFDKEMIEATDYSVRQGHVEMSNVSSAREMVALMEVVRHMESQQKSFRTKDEMIGDAIRTLGAIT